MKIGLVCPNNIHRIGGVQECVLAVREGLEAAGHSALILTPQPRDSSLSAPPGVVYVGKTTEVRALRTINDLSASGNPEGLNDLLEREQFDVLHFMEPWLPMLSRQILSRSTSVNIATFHAKLPDTMMHRTIERVITPYTGSILKYFQALTAVSDTAATYVRSLTDRPIEIIPNGIDLKKYQPSKNPRPKGSTLVYIGRLEPRKGIKYLLKAYALLSTRMPEVRLLIAGYGPDREKWEELVREWNLKDVHFLGQVSEEEKLKLLHESHVFCSLAPYGESFGIVLLEAMASGLPIVAADNPGYTAVLTGNGAVSLVNPKDSDAVARQMELLLKDEQLRKHWQNWAKQELPQYDYKKIVDRYIQLYQQQLKNRA